MMAYLATATVFLLGPATSAFARDGDINAMTPLTRVFGGLPHAVVHASPIVYVALDTGIESFDVRDLSSPLLLDELYLPSPAYDLALDGDKLYVANGESGMTVVDVADPYNLLLTAQLPLPVGSGAEARGIEVSAGVVYVAESATEGSTDFGLRVIDVNTATPFQLSHLALDNGALCVTVDPTRNVALVGFGSELAGRAGGLVTIDVSNLATPMELAGSYLRTGLAVNRIVVSNQTAFLAVGDQLAGAFLAVDISTPSAPSELDRLPLTNGAMDLSLLANRAYVAARENGLLVLDVTNPSNLARLGSVPLDELAMAVAARGDVAFVGARSSNGRGALLDVATSAPAAMTVLGSHVHTEATAVVTVTGLGYLLRRDALHVFDISVAATPAWVGGWTNADPDFSALACDGRIAAVADGKQIHIVDVTNPALPTHLASTAIGFGTVVRVTLEGMTLYAITGRGIEVFDVSNPATPNFVTALRVGTGMAAAMTIDGDLGALVAGEDVFVIDLTNPVAPTVIGQTTLVGDLLRGVDLSADLLVAVGISNFYVLNLTTPTAPTLSAVLPRPGYDVRLVGDRAIVAAGRDGIRAVDVSTPTLPNEEAWFDTSGEATIVANDGAYLFAATMAAQHWTMFCDTCEPVCVNAWPTVAWNSLRAIRLGGITELTWTIASGSGTFNVHRTLDKTLLPLLYNDMGAVAVSSPTTMAQDGYNPPTPGTAHYRVFGVGSCDNLSHYP